MVQRIFSILIVAAVLSLPVQAAAGHRDRPAWARSGQAWADAVARYAAPWARPGKLFLVQRGRDHDRARDAVSAGNVLPLQQILQQIRGRYPGRLLDADLARNDQGRWVYRLKLLAPDNQVQRLAVDAQSGRLLRNKARR